MCGHDTGPAALESCPGLGVNGVIRPLPVQAPRRTRTEQPPSGDETTVT